MSWFRSAFLLSVLTTLLVPMPVSAGGFEIPATGTRAAGRGGAFTARADDPLATWYNPANLAALDGVMVTADVHLPWWQSCYERSGTYGGFLGGATLDPPASSRFGTLGNPGGPGDYTNEPFPRSCRQGGPQITPTVLLSMRVTDWLGLGFGFVAPAGSGTNVWGSRDGVVQGVFGDERPAPHRYTQVFTDTTLVRLAFGGGLRLAPWLRIGGTFLWGISLTDTSMYGVVESGELPGRDVRVDMTDMTDWFVPGAIGSIHIDPMPELDFAFTVNWSGDINSRGDGQLTFADFAQEGDPAPGATVPSSARLPLGLHVPQPLSVRFGMRYAMQRPGAEHRRRQGKARDPMRDEIFDLELNVGWEQNSRIDAFTVTNRGDTRCPQDGSGEHCFNYRTPNVDSQNTLPARNRQPKGFRDQVTLHLGSDWNVVPDRLALRSGLSFESMGYDLAMWQIDFQPGRRMGLHLGATLRLKGLNVSLAYARIFQWDTVVPEGEGEVSQLLGGNPAGLVTINEGRYENAWHLFSVSLQYRFGDAGG
jgi:long-subunit fatty acid transport protein